MKNQNKKGGAGGGGTGRYHGPNVIAYGPAGGGKGGVVRAALAAARRRHAAVSCLECHSVRLLFTAVLKQLRAAGAGDGPGAARQRADAEGAGDRAPAEIAGESPAEGGCAAAEGAEEASGRRRYGVDRVDDFLEKLARACPLDGPTHYIVLEQAERLRTRAAFPALLALMRARELAGANVHVVLVSRSGWDEYEAFGPTGGAEPIPVAFPAYSDADLVRVLAQMRYPLGDTGGAASTADGDAERELYCRFASVCIATLARATTSARELHAVVGELWAEAAARSVAAKNLWSLPSREQEATLQWVRKRAKAVLESGGQCVALGPFPEARAREDALAREGAPASTRAGAAALELPFVSKLLLLAAHIASRNAQSLDSALFTSTGAVRKRRKRSAAAMAATQEAADAKWLSGPGVFALERLYAIYACIVDAEWGEDGLPTSVKDPTADLLSQVASLAAVNLLATAGGDPLDASARFRCNVGDEVIESVARQVGFPLHKYAVRQAA
eukprot:PRCOL_00005952-RA